MTAQSDIAPLARVLLKHARDAFPSEAAIDAQWRDLGYLERPDRSRAIAQYDAFAALLATFGVAIEYLPPNDLTGLDSIYVRDASIICDRGAILCGMGKPQRRTEPAAQETHFRSWKVPIVGVLAGSATIEGGDVCWLGPRTLAVARGYRTNDAGIARLRELLGSSIEVIVAPLPHWRGPGDVFHLMSIISPIADDLALVYSPLMPVPFRELLIERGIALVEVPDEEFVTLGCNVLAVAPRRCVMVEGNPETRRRLEAAGCEVHEFAGSEICVKGGGGPTCLTRPLERRVSS